MHLEHFSLRGLISNGGDQVLHLEDHYDFASRLMFFIEQRKEDYSADTIQGLDLSGYGARLESTRVHYPRVRLSRWFKREAVAILQQWVLNHRHELPCRMEQFAIQPGQLDDQPAGVKS